MKTSIAQLVAGALESLPDLGGLDDLPAIGIERTRDPKHGDFACNIAMQLAKLAKRNPRELAQNIVDALPDNSLIEKVEIAGPGFINFSVTEAAFHELVCSILDDPENYGRSEPKAEPKILLEFISANPTGPLHVGHGRHASYGATVGNLLDTAGYDVDREYYVNDAGRQMDILGVSVWLRMLEAAGSEFEFPAGGYRGDYIIDIAARAPQPAADIDSSKLFADLPDAEQKDAQIDELIRRAQELIGVEGFDAVRQFALEDILEDIKDDLAEFGVVFDRWFSEQSLTTDGRIDEALAVLEERGMLYVKDGATWFKATDFGDEKDRVVVRENGVKTYFASDIAYHYDKRQRGYDLLIDLLGSDHHGYVARVRAGLEAMGYKGDDLEVQLVQFVSLYRGGEKQSMSTRSGEFITLRQLREEVGNDAARFFYVMRSNDQHLDFDMELAKERSNDNPVYYIQYAHARAANVVRKLAEKSLTWDETAGRDSLALLDESHETSLMRAISRYPEVIELAANNRAPQHLVHYLRDLATEFHSYYNAHKVIIDDDKLRNARLTLFAAVRAVIANGLGVIGVSAPEKM